MTSLYCLAGGPDQIEELMSTAPIAMNGICPGVWTGNHITGDSSGSRENASGVLQERITASSHAGSTMVCTRPSRVADTHQPRSSQRTCSVSSGWSSILEGYVGIEKIRTDPLLYLFVYFYRLSFVCEYHRLHETTMERTPVPCRGLQPICL